MSPPPTVARTPLVGATAVCRPRSRPNVATARRAAGDDSSVHPPCALDAEAGTRVRAGRNSPECESDACTDFESVAGDTFERARRDRRRTPCSRSREALRFRRARTASAAARRRRGRHHHRRARRARSVRSTFAPRGRARRAANRDRRTDLVVQRAPNAGLRRNRRSRSDGARGRRCRARSCPSSTPRFGRKRVAPIRPVRQPRASPSDRAARRIATSPDPRRPRRAMRVSDSIAVRRST